MNDSMNIRLFGKIHPSFRSFIALNKDNFPALYWYSMLTRKKLSPAAPVKSCGEWLFPAVMLKNQYAKTKIPIVPDCEPTRFPMCGMRNSFLKTRNNIIIKIGMRIMIYFCVFVFGLGVLRVLKISVN